MPRNPACRSLWTSDEKCENKPPTSKPSSWTVRKKPNNVKELKIVLKRTDVTSFSIAQPGDVIKSPPHISKSPRRKILREKQISELLDVDDDENQHDDSSDDGRASPVYDLQEDPTVYIANGKSKSKRHDSDVTALKRVKGETPAKHGSVVTFCKGDETPKSSKKSTRAAPNTPKGDQNETTTATTPSTRGPKRLSTAPVRFCPDAETAKLPTSATKKSTLESQTTATTPQRSRRSCVTPKRYRDPNSSGDEFEEKIEVRSAKKAKTTNEKKPKIEPKKRSTKKKVETDSEEEFKANLSDDDEEEFHSAVEGSDSGDDFVQDDDTKRKKKLSKTKPKTTERIKSVPNTPKSACKRRIMTPRIPERKIKIKEAVSPLQEAQLRLHVAAVPDNLPCRENEFAEIFSFAEAKITDGIGGCMYISGVPGTGKTATVREVIRQLNIMVDDGDLPKFDFFEINGMRLTEPNQAYVQIWKMMSNGEKATAEHAKNLLEKRFTGQEEKRSSSNKKMTILLVDELDMLWNRKQSVLYNIFEWPTYKSAKLVVLAIANTMDLPERVMINRVASRVGLTRLTFSPYTHQQLQEIVAARLSGLEVFDKDAIQLVARKVASLSGDARRALDICRRAAELAQRDVINGNVVPTKSPRKTQSGSLVQLKHVNLAHQEMFCSPKILAVRHCSAFEKIFLKCCVAIFHQTGIEETSLVRVYSLVNEQAHLDGKSILTEPEIHSLVGRLAASRLVLIEPGKCGRLDMKVRLNISQDDVTFALQDQKYDEE